MATTTLPQRRSGGVRWGWLAVGGAILVLAVVGIVLFNRRQSATTTTAVSTTTVAAAPIVASVSGTGSVAAAQSLDLAFQGSGSVTEVLAEAGDQVQA
ncbi:MAG TPA: hypothetical protein VFX76_06200, partial [Roseiflexaceae bacterium]|nr:hypothetical protein [Roseiflexaceae bacterium]